MLTQFELIIGGAGLFLALTVIQSFAAPPVIRRTYLHYAAYLLFILLYFITRAHVPPNIFKHLEAVFFSGAVICYLLFAKVLFSEREPYPFLRDITNLGIFGVCVCFMVEKMAHFFIDNSVLTEEYIKLVDGLLRGLLASFGLFFAVLIYNRYPAERSFSGFFLLGNMLVLLGGIIAIIISILPMFQQLPNQNLDHSRIWSFRIRGLVMESVLLLEIVCFSLAIKRRQMLDGVLRDTGSLPSEYQSSTSEQVPGALSSSPTTYHPSLGRQIGTTPIFSGASHRIAFRTNKGFELMKKSDIILIQGGGNGANFIKIFKKGQANPVIVLHTLSHTLRMLTEEVPVFQQPHKSYIINIQKICRLQRDEDGITVAVMDNGMEVPITADRLPIIKSLLGLD